MESRTGKKVRLVKLVLSRICRLDESRTSGRRNHHLSIDTNSRIPWRRTPTNYIPLREGNFRSQSCLRFSLVDLILEKLTLPFPQIPNEQKNLHLKLVFINYSTYFIRWKDVIGVEDSLRSNCAIAFMEKWNLGHFVKWGWIKGFIKVRRQFYFSCILFVIYSTLLRKEIDIIKWI